MWNVRGGVIGAVLALGVAGVAGCSSGSDDTVAGPLTSLPPPAAPTPAVVSPSPTTQLLGENTGEAAQEAVRRYIQVVNEAYATGDVSELRTHIHPACKVCARQLASVEEVYTDGDSFAESKVRPTSVVAGGDGGTTERGVMVRYDFDGLVLRRATGQLNRIEEAGRARLDRYDVRYEAGSWRIVGVEALS